MVVPAEQITLKQLALKAVPKLDVIAGRMRPPVNKWTFYMKIRGERTFSQAEFAELARVTGIAQTILENAPTDEDVKRWRRAARKGA